MARTIKRYDNRKLYDTEASSYVSQQDVAALVRRGETVRVVDNSTGEDLTAQTLTQIILEEGKEDGQGLLPAETLHSLLRRGSQAAGQVFDQTLGEGARQVGQRLDQVKKGASDLAQQSLAQLNRLARNAAGWDPADARAEEVQALRQQLARLETRLADVLDRVEEDGDGGVADDPPSSVHQPLTTGNEAGHATES